MKLLTLTTAALVVVATPAHADGKTWNQIVDKAFEVSATQNHGTAISDRKCIPEARQCMTSVQYDEKDGFTVKLVVWEDAQGKLVARKVCRFNLTHDVITCVNFDNHAINISMKGTDGQWQDITE